MEAQDYERAITAFSKAINLRSNQTVFYVKRAECYLQLCDFQVKKSNNPLIKIEK